MNIENTKVNFELLSLDDSKPLHFTPRIDMDRIQAIDTMLGNLSTENKIYLKDNHLIDKCDTNEPATLNLALGNPIDLPIEVDLKLNAKNIELLRLLFCRISAKQMIIVSNVSYLLVKVWYHQTCQMFN